MDGLNTLETVGRPNHFNLAGFVGRITQEGAESLRIGASPGPGRFVGRPNRSGGRATKPIAGGEALT